MLLSPTPITVSTVRQYMCVELKCWSSNATAFLQEKAAGKMCNLIFTELTSPTLLSDAQDFTFT